MKCLKGSIKGETNGITCLYWCRPFKKIERIWKEHILN
jgi:hypothetical protein